MIAVSLDAAKKRNSPCKQSDKDNSSGPVCGVRPGLHAHSEYLVHSVDGREVLFNEDVFSGTGVANMFFVILLEGPPVGHEREYKGY